MTLHDFFIAVMIGFIILLMSMLIRVFRGPTIFDRLNGLGVIGTDAVIVLIIMGVISGREDMYLDIAMSYSILGFIGSVVIARYLSEEVKRKG